MVDGSPVVSGERVSPLPPSDALCGVPGGVLAGPSWLSLPEDALLALLACCERAELFRGAALVAHALSLLCLHASLWMPAADVTDVSPGALRRLAAAGAFDACVELRCRQLWPELLVRGPLLRSLQLLGRVSCSACAEALSVLPGLSSLEVRVGAGPWTGCWGGLLLAAPVAGGALRLRALRMQTESAGFAEAAALWVSDFCPVLEELTWSLDPHRVNRKRRRDAYTRFLRILSAAMCSDFARRRPAFRVNVFNGAALPPRLAVWCSICSGQLFRGERIYAIGPGTQRHIDVEAYLWGCSRSELSAANTWELHCARRCHEAAGLYLLAAAGGHIDTCGFPFACACGPDLALLGPAAAGEEAELPSVARSAAVGGGPVAEGESGAWLQAFLAKEGSLPAPDRYLRG